MTDYIADVFGKGGLFARHFPGYEQRDGQVALARMVDAAMRDNRHALGEGPCGTGKGMAYGVPAVWHATQNKKRVVIVTANIALQEQLVTKDLPRLAEVLPWHFEFALIKGRNNYLCKNRKQQKDLLDDAQQVEAIERWAETTESGDVSELPFLPAPAVWSQFSVTSEDCIGRACPYQSECYANIAKKRAASAHVVVTNYHLLYGHLITRAATGQDLVLPPFDYLVLDEAHEAADIARDFFGFTVSAYSVNRIANYVAEIEIPSKKDERSESVGKQLRRVGADFFAELSAYRRSSAYRCRLRTPNFADPAPLLDTLSEAAQVIRLYALKPGITVENRALAEVAIRSAETISARLTEAIALADDGKVYYVDLDKRGRAKIGAKLIDVADSLRTMMFDETDSVTMVSATMTTTDRSFQFISSEVGAPDDALTYVAPSPFCFRKQALLILPDGLPDPREPSFTDAISAAFQRVIDGCGGKTLGLFTSYKNLNAVYDRVSRGGYRVLRQGELPRTELARIFREDVRSVLLGTDSFWTGIDVPGDALTGLVIDKLPFPNMDDPVVDAICARNKNAFGEYLMPRAVIRLRQGVGRLIRSQTDVGVVVILDPRLTTKPYGRKFLGSLPPMLTVRTTDGIPAFLARAKRALA